MNKTDGVVTFWKVRKDMLAKPEPIVVTNVTARTITLPNGSTRIRTGNVMATQYFPTYKEARDFVVKRADDRLRKARHHVQQAEAIMATMNALPKSVAPVFYGVP